jgi:hypothetical protein
MLGLITCQDGDVVNRNMMIDHVEKPSGLAVLVFCSHTRIKSKEKVLLTLSI